jgi:hypothetical protein
MNLRTLKKPVMLPVPRPTPIGAGRGTFVLNDVKESEASFPAFQTLHFVQGDFSSDFNKPPPPGLPARPWNRPKSNMSGAWENPLPAHNVPRGG